ncbi:MAG: aminotransferase class I/II-fold pyridoxal phosphate-dependent enzyme [Gammaproteobacteria bacterium]
MEYENLLEVLASAATDVPDKLAYKFLNEENNPILTYRNLDTKAKALAATLQRYSCYRERVMLLLPPGLDYIVAFFGCLYAGMTPVPAYPPRRNHHGERLSAIVHDAQAKFILTQKVFVEQCRFVPHVISMESIDEADAIDYKPIHLNLDDLAFLQYTSGSTTTPKGVMISHKNILTNLEIIKSHFGAVDAVCSWLPPYHDMGLIGGILYPLYLRKRVVLMAPAYFLQNPLRWLDIIANEKISTTVAPNFAYDLCVKKVTPEEIQKLDLSCWQHALNGAEPIRYETMKRFYKTFATAGFLSRVFRPVYGLAEATLIVSASAKRTWEEPLFVSKTMLREGKSTSFESHSKTTTVSLISCGQNPKNHVIKIVNPHTLEVLPDNEVGEIWVSGPSIAAGYWNNPTLTETTLKAKLPGQPDTTYLRTGDLGFLHEKELFVTGRAKDLIIINGVNHYPQDIEQSIAEVHPAFQPHGTAAFTIEHNNEEQLVIMQEIGRTYLNKFNPDEAYEAIRSIVLSQHGLQIHQIILVKPLSLPKTSSGKIQRWICRQMVSSNEVSSIARWTRLEENKQITTEDGLDCSIYIWIKNWVAKRSPFANPINLGDSLAACGFDSLIVTEFSADLQAYLGHSIDPAVILEQKTIADLIQVLKNDKTKIKSNVSCTQYALVPSSVHPLDKAVKDIYFNITHGISRDTTTIGESSFINYAGYNYLGMSGDPTVTAAVIEAIREYGTSVSASRIASGQKPTHILLENAIADLIGAQACLVYSSGHATNVSVISHLFGPNDLILHDALCHNSILQGAIFSGATRIAFPHNDCAALQVILEKQRPNYEKVLIVSEGIFSMDGDIPDIHGLIALKEKFSTFLMLDEAHSIGVLGKTGAGIREYFKLKASDVDIWMGTLSKAFASCGGYIAGSKELIEHLKYNAAAFVYSAGISPANTAAAYAAIQLMKTEPVRLINLKDRHQLLLHLLKEANIPTGYSYDTPIIPIITKDDMAALNLSIALKEKGIYTIPILYPAVEKDKARVRLFVNCLHTLEQIRYTARVITDSYHSLNKLNSHSECVL